MFHILTSICIKSILFQTESLIGNVLGIIANLLVLRKYSSIHVANEKQVSENCIKSI